VRDKKRLTQELLKLLPEAQRITLTQAIPAWWYNIRKTGGMRLTGIGYQTFVEELELEHYTYTIKDSVRFTHQNVLALDRKMQMPYYIYTVKQVPKQIILFGSKEAVMINLYSNLQQFLDNYYLKY
jgi:hypothetical protein